MVANKKVNTTEDLELLKQGITLDDDGMLIILDKRFIITPQDTFSDMMRAAADIGGINFAKVIMRRTGYEAAYRVSESMIKNLKLSGEDLIKYYTETAGKRGWYFGVMEKLDAKNGVFLFRTSYSPFIIRFTEKSKVSVCDFLAGAFEAMFHAGGFEEMRIVETQCVAKGDPACVFEGRNK